MPGYVSPPLRVYLIDDHDIVRRGLRDLLAVKRDLTVVGDSASGREAVPRIVHLAPDVVVLDLHLQDGSGIPVARAIRAQAPHVKVLMLTSAGDDEALTAAVLAGASGYATKLVESLGILHGIRQIGAGRSVLDQREVQRVEARLRRESADLGLADRERAVLELLLDGLTDTQIANRLSVPVETVTADVTRLIDQLQPSSL